MIAAYMKIPEKGLGPVPFPEEPEKLILGGRFQILLSQRARNADRGSHLVEIAPAALANLQMGVKSFSLSRR